MCYRGCPGRNGIVRLTTTVILAGLAIITVSAAGFRLPAVSDHRGAEELLRAGAPLARQIGINGAQRMIPTSLVFAASFAQPFFEYRLSLGARHLFRLMRGTIANLAKYLRVCVRKWKRWASSALLFVLIAPLAALLDRRLVQTWREHGFRALGASSALAIAVYIRLLVDHNASAVGKGLLALAIVYGVVSNDLIPDYVLPLGIVDDVIAVIVASRMFTRLCPDWVIERHAVMATQTWERLHRAAY